MKVNFITASNGHALKLSDAACIPWALLRAEIIESVRQGHRVSSLFGVSVNNGVEIYAVLTNDILGNIKILRSTATESKFSSLTHACPQAHLFEREIAEQLSMTPEGHPWLKPVRFVGPINGAKTTKPIPEIGAMDFYRVTGEETHEVAVGPVHAGVIEPGHFRFQCHGENVFHLEISLGYQHRGIERALIGGPNKLSLRQIETAAGDTSVGHSWAYAQSLESLSGVRASANAEVIRCIALELERLANHVGDLGALAGDVGYLPTMSFCGRLRGDFLNMTALICGNRFGRSLVVPGGVRYGIDNEIRDELLKRLKSVERDVNGALKLLWDSPSVMARFEGTGAVSSDAATEIGLVGPAARASGLDRDIRTTHPFGIYKYNLISLPRGHQGDVASRAFVRSLEIGQSIQLIKEQLERIENVEGELREPIGKLEPDSMVVSLIEGWRGEICHVAITDPKGKFARYKICDPSFHNWQGLALALRKQQISDFPLCNKSFNLSYCGFDL